MILRLMKNTNIAETHMESVELTLKQGRTQISTSQLKIERTYQDNPAVKSANSINKNNRIRF